MLFRLGSKREATEHLERLAISRRYYANYNRALLRVSSLMAKTAGTVGSNDDGLHTLRCAVFDLYVEDSES